MLEELLASLIQSAGYSLLTEATQDPEELVTGRTGDVLVKGRGGNHQVDVLGEFVYVPAFSQPIRLFVEAKARRRPVGLPIVRNAVGTIIDVNEAWMIDYSTNRTRRHYRYALFSSSGFSTPAQDYAVAHQISLVDLSGPEWAALVDLARGAAADFLDIYVDEEAFPLRRLRQVLRHSLGTVSQDQVGRLPFEALLPPYMRPFVDNLSNTFRQILEGALLVFPASGQVQLARPDDLRAFLARVDREPAHAVTLSVAREQRDTRRGRTWVIRPIGEPEYTYSLRLTLPTFVESRVLAESSRIEQVLRAKDELGGRLDIFWDPKGRYADLLPGPRLFRLTFPVIQLRERRPEF